MNPIQSKETDRVIADVDHVVAEYLADWEEGRPPVPAELLGRHPHLAAELSAFLEAFETFEQIADPIRHALGLSSAAGGEAPTPPNLPTIPAYQVVRELGRGGMGVVYLARHLELDRQVALKICTAEAPADSVERQRFLAEARTSARLDHPHIVRIYDVGAHQGVPFLALEYVPGCTLAQRLSSPPHLTDLQTARLVEKLARAIAHAHRQGFLHRDLKPANVLLQRPAELGTALAGNEEPALVHRHWDAVVPRIADFGLARPLAPEKHLTSTDLIVGTASYMTPEQAGRRTDLTPAVDVYGLGAILYECLTGRPPFRGENLLATLKMVEQTAPEPPRNLRLGVDPELEHVCLRCLEKDPKNRYPDADALAHDLAEIGKRLEAGPSAPPETGPPPSRFRRRAFLVGAVLVMLGVLVFLTVPWGSRPTANTPLAESLDLVLADLKQVPPEQRSGRRYLLAGLSPSPEETSRRLEELAEHLSPDDPAALRPLDSGRTVFVLRWDSLGQDEEAWRTLLADYPYGLNHARDARPPVRQRALALRELVDEPLPVVRADWLVQAVVRSKLFADRTWPAGLVRWTREYPDQELGLEQAAAEVGVSTAALRRLLAEEPRLVGKLGLAALASGGRIPRSVWEDVRFTTSPFQEISRDLLSATPVRP